MTILFWASEARVVSESGDSWILWITPLLESDPSGEQAQALLARWETLLDVETNGDEDIKTDVAAWVRRRDAWPDGMKRYIASLYATDAETWSRVTDFIEQALACKTSGDRPLHPGA